MTSHHDQPVHRWNGANFEMAKDTLADESVVQLHLNGEHITTLLATNADLDCLIRGHLATQYHLVEIESSSSISTEHANGIHVVNLDAEGSTITNRRTEIVTTSCGACNLDGLADIVKQTPHVNPPDFPYNLNKILDSYTIIINDISEMKKIEEQSKRDEKLLAMGEFASSVAHEIRNPINSIGMIGQRPDHGIDKEVGALFRADTPDGGNAPRSPVSQRSPVGGPVGTGMETAGIDPVGDHGPHMRHEGCSLGRGGYHGIHA